jgi:hypothetical protein
MKIPRRKQKVKYSRKLACKYLTSKGDISNSLQPLCFCPERDLVLGTRAYVCQVCILYSQTNKKISEIYDESRKVAEKKIKDKKIKLEEFEIAEIKADEEIDLTIDEFEEEDEEIPLKFEKRKAGKADIEDSEEFGEIECPFCGELFEDLASHIQSCEFAPDDASIEDVLPARAKKKKKKKAEPDEAVPKEKQKCPYCGKEFVRLGRHLTSCPNRPEDADKEEE